MAETSALFQTIFKAYVDIPQATGEGRLPQVCVKRWLPGMWKFARCAMGGRVCFGPALCAEVSLAEAKLVRESVCARASCVGDLFGSSMWRSTHLGPFSVGLSFW